MKIIVQRVLEADVSVEGSLVGKIEKGLLVLLGIHREDTLDQVAPFVEKLIQLRIFYDEAEKMNLSLLDVQGQLLIVSQFTLYANCNSGRRPSFTESAPPSVAESLYTAFIQEAKKRIQVVETGIFGAHMQVHLINDGPVSLILENR